MVTPQRKGQTGVQTWGERARPPGKAPPPSPQPGKSAVRRVRREAGLPGEPQRGQCKRRCSGLKSPHNPLNKFNLFSFK